MLTAVIDGLPPGIAAPTLSVDEALAHLPVPAACLDAAHHTVLEAVTNVLRHTTGVTGIDIQVRVHPDLPGLAEVSVFNDGEPATPPLPSGGFGLTGLAERVQAAGGELHAGPVASGWLVTAVLPITGRAPGHAVRASA
jgi:signal transduction histidine kinase